MTGTGKSTFFESMALQDIREGGKSVFDPHGDAIDGIFEKDARRERTMSLSLVPRNAKG